MTYWIYKFSLKESTYFYGRKSSHPWTWYTLLRCYFVSIRVCYIDRYFEYLLVRFIPKKFIILLLFEMFLILLCHLFITFSNGLLIWMGWYSFEQACWTLLFITLSPPLWTLLFLHRSLYPFHIRLLLFLSLQLSLFYALWCPTVKFEGRWGAQWVTLSLK